MERKNGEDEHIASSLLVREDRNNNNVSGCRYTAANSGSAAQLRWFSPPRLLFVNPLFLELL